MKSLVFKDLLTIEKDIKNILVNNLDLYEQQRFLVNYKKLINQTVQKIHSLHNGIKSFVEDSNTITFIPSNNINTYRWNINNTFKMQDSKNDEKPELYLFIEDDISFFKVEQEYIHDINQGQRENFRLNFNSTGDTNTVTFILTEYNLQHDFSEAGDYSAFKRFWPLVESYVKDSFQAIHNNYDSILFENTKKFIDIAPILILAEKHEELRDFLPNSKSCSLTEIAKKLNTPEALEIMEVISLKDDTDANKILENYIANTQSKPYFKNSKLP